MDDAAAHREAVADLGLFAGLDLGRLERVVERSSLATAAAGDELVRQGERGDECYVILDGKASVTVDGTEVHVLGPEDCVGELAVLDGAPRSATVTARTPMRLLAFAPGAFRDLLAEAPEVHARLTADLARRLRTTSTGWGQLAGDADLLLAALLDLQASPDPDVAARARSQAARLVAQEAEAASPGSPELDALTPAELRVAELVAEGLSNPTIAERLYISRHTVESHLKHMYVKLGLRSRVELATAVLRAG